MRKYRPADFNTVWLLDQACFAPGIAYTRYELLTYMRRPGAFTLLAEEGPAAAGVVGFIVAETSRRGIGHIITIDVRADVRRHGVGSTLLDAAEQRLRTAKCHAVRLETAVDNVSALAFYKRHGYDVLKVIPHYYSNGVDALLLGKVFPESEPAS